MQKAPTVFQLVVEIEINRATCDNFTRESKRTS